jgi:CRP-like cAMP-binding protein
MDIATLQSYVKPILELSEQDTALLATAGQEVKLKKDDILLKEGEICRRFFLVEKGYLRTFYDKDGVEINMNFTFEGEFTTNLRSLRNRQPSETSIEAGEDTIVWIFDLDQLVEQFSDNPGLMRFIRRMALSMLLTLEAHSDLFKIYTPAERYRHIEKNNPRLLQRISLSQMASYLGVARETLSRIRAKNN